MSWSQRGSRGSERSHGRPVAHAGRAVWLWCKDHRSTVYDPESAKWKALRAEPFAGSGTRDGSVVASIGDELIVWGGGPKYFRSSSRSAVSGGVRLGSDNTWRALATKHQPSARAYAIHAWTGRELVIWGGAKGSPIKNGAAYDPAGDTWRKLATKDAATTHNGDHIWTGSELWLWGGASMSRKGIAVLHSGHAYDPAADRWRTLAGVPGRKQDALNARAIVRLRDVALYVRRDESSGSDLDTCSVWRYEPRADLWEPCTPPPEVQGADPKLVDCDGRIVLVLGRELFEYLPARDAWARLPTLPDPFRMQFLWLAGALHAFDHRGPVHRLVLPDAPEAIAPATTRQFAPATPARPEVGRGSPVTALAIAGEDVLIGHGDGAVRRGDNTVRAADATRILGLAIHDGTWTCLAGNQLEVRALAGAGRATQIALPFAAHALAHHGDRMVVAGTGAIAALAWQRKRWSVERTVRMTGTTTEVAIHGAVVARTVLGEASGRRKSRDAVELRDATTLKLLGTLAPTVERGTTSAVPVPNGAIIAGGGSYDMERHLLGKRRASAKIKTDTAWSSPIVASADGTWVLARTAGSGAELYDLRDERRELMFQPFPDDDDDDHESLSALHPPPAFLPADEAAAFADSVRFGGAVSAMAIDAAGETLALGTSVGATFVIDRERLGVTMIPATGPAAVWQPPRCELAGSEASPIAIAGEAERGIVCVIRRDGRFGELDAGTGEWTWGPALPHAALAALREYDFEVMAARRRGNFITVLHTASDVFDYRTGAQVPPKQRRPHPDGRALWTLREGRKPCLVKLDAITLEESARIALPGQPEDDTLVWLGGERWMVQLEKGYRIVDASTGKVVDADTSDAASETLDGIHFAIPEGQDGPFRRWRIYGADLADPVRTLESHLRFASLAVLPGGAITGWCDSMIAFFDREGTLLGSFEGHGRSITGVCPSLDGAHVVTWDEDGTFRRWSVDGTTGR